MNRPYVICHMTMSINGKVTGDFLTTDIGEKGSALYYHLNRQYEADGFACGRVTMEGSFTGGWFPDLTRYDLLLQNSIDRTDYISDTLSGFYAVAFDPHGRLGWQTNRIVDPDEDPGYDRAQIVEVLTEQVDDRYLAYLKTMDIPYIFAGKHSLDVPLALEKLKTKLGINTLLLEGGSVLNGAFAKVDVIDELSLVLCPLIAESEGKPLFMNSLLSKYRLETVETHDGGIVWLNYKRKYHDRI